MRAFLLPLALVPMLTACEGNALNLFTIQDDMDLGAQLRDEILANPDEYPLVDAEEYPDAYAHLDRVVTEVLDSGEVDHHDDFAWEFYLIDDDVLNAFAAPGGYIYIYTGLIDFLSHEDELAGVLGHEIAHAANRHTTEQLTKIYGVSVLLGVVLGEDQQLITDIATGLAGLSFSRAHEAEADDYSVFYLCETYYAANGAAGFFEALEEMPIPEFLSTHPSSDGRVEDINALAAELGCSTAYYPDAEWQAFLDSLP
ncbi:MAG: M48 family metalloprotease [Deltaproteobacteria bacterium]|nr:M48 family metalloprotease [Deltaproteobacteria bacterium]